MPPRRQVKKIGFTRWLSFSNSAGALTAGTIASTVLTATTLPETVLRTRGTVLAYLDGTQAPSSLVQVSMGMIVVPEGTGSTVLWEPVGDANAPWFYFSRFFLGYEEYVTDVVDAVGTAVYREIVDSKAMRLSPPDTEIQ